MRYLKVLGVALVAMFALGITAISASALPDLSVTLGSAYPIHVNFADNGTTITKLETTGGSKLAGKGVSVLLLSENTLSSLGTFEAVFLGVKDGSAACSNGTEKETVATKGTYHLVTVTLTPTLTSGVAFLVTPLTITCAKVKVEVEGCALSTLTAAAGEITEASGELKGKNGKNTLEKFENDSGTSVECILKANFGTGLLQADEIVEELVTLKVLESKMFEISGL